jgi:hypothetical protein
MQLLKENRLHSDIWMYLLWLRKSKIRNWGEDKFWLSSLWEFNFYRESSFSMGLETLSLQKFNP